MGIPDGAHTHGHSSGPSPGAVLLAMLAAAVIFGPAVAAAAQLLVIVAAVLGGVAVAGVVTFAVLRARHSRAIGTAPVPLPAPPPWRPIQCQPRQAIGQAPEVHVHHHWHGVTAEDVAAVIRGEQDGGG